jgi:plasmid stabilization system protein ParE
VRHAIHPEADAEFADAARYYAEIAPELGARFYLEMERLIRDVCAHPERFRMFDPPARRHFSAQFPYVIIYLVKPDHVWIVAVMHMKRKPGYWRERLG